MKWRPLEADGGRTENAIYIVSAARWRPVEADGGRTENAIYNVIAAKRRPVEADGGQVEARHANHNSTDKNGGLRGLETI